MSREKLHKADAAPVFDIGAEAAAALAAAFASIGRPTEAQLEEVAAKPYRTFADIGFPVPEEDDPNVLFRHNWMGRGGGLTMTASTGVGKSSVSIQQSLCWAVGEPFIGTPIRPIKTAIIQGEDMERDLQEQYSGMVRGFREIYGWDDAKIERAVKNVHIWKCVGLTGDKFIEWLGNQYASDIVDNICINPLQSYFGGDLAAQKDCDHFLREGLDPIIKGERGVPPCMATIMAHTVKFASGAKERANVDDYAEYIGAGSHAIADWARARVVFLKRANSEVYFDFKLAKRARCGWEDAEGNRVSKKVFKHAEGFIFWQEVTDAEELASLDDISTTDRARAIKAHKANDQGRDANMQWLADFAINRLNAPGNPHLDGEWAKEQARRRWGQREGDAVKKAFWNALNDFGLFKDQNGELQLLAIAKNHPDEEDF